MKHLTNVELLECFTGLSAVFNPGNSLAELFGLRRRYQVSALALAEEAAPYAVSDRFLAARELLRRALEETLKEPGEHLSSPEAVKSTRVSLRSGWTRRTG